MDPTGLRTFERLRSAFSKQKKNGATVSRLPSFHIPRHQTSKLWRNGPGKSLGVEGAGDQACSRQTTGRGPVQDLNCWNILLEYLRPKPQRKRHVRSSALPMFGFVHAPLFIVEDLRRPDSQRDRDKKPGLGKPAGKPPKNLRQVSERRNSELVYFRRSPMEQHSSSWVQAPPPLEANRG